ncbi:crotonase/enoyl-CoA hydratase family protein [Novosphingobium colocasiae]|uniref:crotonase/enoyl-CoA hydratase family protein n=1 Tax=Novosphingobium colocasiae TaxID=1256513 RepID=UPI0035B471A2
MTERVTVNIMDGVAEVRLSRPDKLNALDMAMFEAIVAAGDQVRADPGVRAVVFSGDGRSFCVGIDLASLGGDAAVGDGPLAHLEARTHGACNLFQQAAMQWRTLPVPVIAAVHGHALGGGLQLMLGADVRIVAPDTALSVKEVVWGLIPDMAGLVLLRSLVRADVLRDLLFTGRTFNGDEAVALGVATRVDPDPLAAARAMARTIAGFSPDAVRAAKRLCNAADAGLADAELLLCEAREQQTLLTGAAHREAVAAGLARRPAVFADPSG